MPGSRALREQSRGTPPPASQSQQAIHKTHKQRGGQVRSKCEKEERAGMCGEISSELGGQRQLSADLKKFPEGALRPSSTSDRCPRLGSPVPQGIKLGLLPQPHCRQETRGVAILHKRCRSTHSRGNRAPASRDPRGCLSPTSLQASWQAPLDPPLPPHTESPTYSGSNTTEMKPNPTCAPSQHRPTPRQPISPPLDLHYAFSRPFLCCPPARRIPTNRRRLSPSEHLIQGRNPMCVKGLG